MKTPTFPGMEAVDEPVPVKEAEAAAPPRLRRPERGQHFWEASCLEERLADDHPARAVWQLVERLDLTAFYAKIAARGSDPGRAATDPRLLVALWLYAAVDGVGNGRELDRLCREHDAYRWLCGGVSLNYHTLNDFRVEHEAAVDDLLTQLLAVLMHQNLLQVRRISQDGTRVRAAAGTSSFHRRETLARHLAQAAAHVAALKQQQEESAAADARKTAAKARAARERQERLEAALTELAQIEAAKAAQKNKPSKQRPARASSTDPQARVMKMANGGFSPAYNVQLAADPQSRAIVGVDVSNAGRDSAQSAPLRAQVEARTGQKVREHLYDGDFVTLEGIQEADKAHVTVYAPPPKPRKAASPYEIRPGDTPAVAAWRTRMATPEGQAIYQKRAATSETINGELRSYRGLRQFAVRGLRKVRCVVLWTVLAYNFVHFQQALTG